MLPLVPSTTTDPSKKFHCNPHSLHFPRCISHHRPILLREETTYFKMPIFIGPWTVFREQVPEYKHIKKPNIEPRVLNPITSHKYLSTFSEHVQTWTIMYSYKSDLASFTHKHFMHTTLQIYKCSAVDIPYKSCIRIRNVLTLYRDDKNCNHEYMAVKHGDNSCEWLTSNQHTVKCLCVHLSWCQKSLNSEIYYWVY